ncbi:protein kinase [Streptomyces sp. NPDC049097]|uniref:protein kinase domain-containing protein n=1 Tax=Streptomyces sp. NPDC049097 TaxID=3155497 RepID=UPI00342BF143
MDHGQLHTQELIAGRYRALAAVHDEEGRSVWVGEDVESGRPVSLTGSRLAPVRPEDTVRRTVARILRESGAMELLCPGRVAVVLDVVEDHGVLWTVTERIGGTPLGVILARGPLDHVWAARIGLGILDVLEAAHRRGATHGDLSPGQVFVQEGGTVVVTGFGLIGASVTQRVTAPSYAAPEQARGSSAGPAADQWALGALLYAMVEGRAPVKDRGTVESTLRAVDRLPFRHPVNAGPLAPAVTGLLRRDALERVPEPAVRASLTRVLNEEPDEPTHETPLPRLRDAWPFVHRAGPAGSGPSVRRSVLVGAGLVVAASVALLVAAGRPDGGGTSAAGTGPSRSGVPAPPADPTGGGTDRQTPPSSGTTGDPNVGFGRHVAPEGFSVSLPQGWQRIRTESAAEDTYRVTFGASGDPRTLTVTSGVRLAPDPVAVWQSLEPSLKGTYAGYARLGDIRPVIYQGHKGADMEWLSTVDGVRVHTFGRGFLVGDGRGFSLRWTTPAADAGQAVDQQALKVFLRTFRPTGS